MFTLLLNYLLSHNTQAPSYQQNKLLVIISTIYSCCFLLTGSILVFINNFSDQYNDTFFYISVACYIYAAVEIVILSIIERKYRNDRRRREARLLAVHQEEVMRKKWEQKEKEEMGGNGNAESKEKMNADFNNMVF